MPNWVFNKVYFHGEKEKIKALKDFVKGENYMRHFLSFHPVLKFEDFYC